MWLTGAEVAQVLAEMRVGQVAVAYSVGLGVAPGLSFRGRLWALTSASAGYWACRLGLCSGSGVGMDTESLFRERIFLTPSYCHP